MQKIKIVDCCNIFTLGRVFDIPPKNKMRRVLVFQDECPCCLKPVALIKAIDFDYNIKTVTRKTGKDALKLFDKFRDCRKERDYKTKNGAASNMSWLWLDGLKDNWVRDLNNTKVFELDAAVIRSESELTETLRKVI